MNYSNNNLTLTDSINVTKVAFFEVGGMHDQAYRPYTSDFTASDMQDFKNATNDGNTLNVNSLLKVSNKLLHPSNTAGEIIQFPGGGMNEHRLAFMISVETKSILNGGSTYQTEVELYSGLTDGVGIIDNHRGGFNIDPNMKLYINDCKCISTHQDEINTRVNHGGLITSDSVLGTFNGLNMSVGTLRPEDCMNATSVNLANIVEGDVIHNLTNKISTSSCLSALDNDIAPSYLNTVFNAYKLGSNETESSDISEIVVQAAPFTASTSVTKYSFLTSINATDQSSNKFEFTFGMLNSVYPKPDDFYKVNLSKRNGQARNLLNTEHWMGCGVETNLVISMTHILPQILTKSLMTGARIRFTNKTQLGDISITTGSITGVFGYQPLPSDIDVLICSVRSYIIETLFVDKIGDYEVDIHASLLDTCMFNIQINGGVMIPFAAPMFCSSYTSPQIDSGVNKLNELRSIMETVVTELIPGVNNVPSYDAVNSGIITSESETNTDQLLDAYNSNINSPQVIVDQYGNPINGNTQHATTIIHTNGIIPSNPSERYLTY